MSAAKDDTVLLADMLGYARRASARAKRVSRQEWDADEFLRFGMAHMLQIIGEAASRLSATTREALPDLPWQRLIGLRHRLVHGYGHIDFDIVLQVATERLEPLIAALEAHLTPPEPPSA